MSFGKLAVCGSGAAARSTYSGGQCEIGCILMGVERSVSTLIRTGLMGAGVWLGAIGCVAAAAADNPVRPAPPDVPCRTPCLSSAAPPSREAPKRDEPKVAARPSVQKGTATERKTPPARPPRCSDITMRTALGEPVTVEENEFLKKQCP